MISRDTNESDLGALLKSAGDYFIPKAETEEIIKSVKGALKDWQKVAKKLGAQVSNHTSSSIKGITPSSAGSHLTERRVSRVSHAAASCSLRCMDSETRPQMKQCMVRWKFG